MYSIPHFVLTAYKPMLARKSISNSKNIVANNIKPMLMSNQISATNDTALIIKTDRAKAVIKQPNIR
jgi:hypothetical protein